MIPLSAGLRIGHLAELLHEIEEKASKALLDYKKYFDCRVKKRKGYQAEDLVYEDNPPIVPRSRAGEDSNRQDT